MAAKATAKSVFAHVIMGNICSYTEDTWKSDISLAQNASINAFVLNITPPLSDDCLQTQMTTNDLGTGFKLFFSFDYLGNNVPWAAADVVSVLTTHGSNAAYFKSGSDNYPPVSTFEGTKNIGDWDSIRSQVGGIFFVPDWTSLGPDRLRRRRITGWPATSLLIRSSMYILATP
ncbi:MAG: hypothetical protein M1818_005961 [Claussenomyces sp. TS43310]|nr:MAG: hypothetical protein M1818_005961 [Claussenomyces sp. TS43310]